MRRIPFSLWIIGLGVLVIALNLLPVQTRILYEGSGLDHALLFRIGIISEKFGIGTKIVFGKQKKKSKWWPFRVPKRSRLKIFGWQQQLPRMQNFYNPVQRILLRHSTCRRFRWETAVGCRDYADTGIVVGLLWAVQESVAGWLGRLVKIEKAAIQIQVTPYFGRNCFESSIDCILEVRLGHIILELIRFFLGLQ